MGNSSTSFLPTYSCFDSNLSGNSVTPEYWNSHSISNDFRINSVLSAAVSLLFLVIGLPSNVFIIVSIIQKKLCQDTAHILLLNLALSDFLVCLLVIPFIVVTGFAGEFVFGGSDSTRCQICQFGVILVILSVVSIHTICWMSIDRFIFIKFPLRYEKWVTKYRVMAVLFLSWLLAIAEGILPVFGIGEIQYSYRLSTCTLNLDDVTINGISNRQYGIFIAALQIPPVTMAIIVNTWIACIARVQVKRVYRTRRNLGNQIDLTGHSKSLRKKIHKQKNKVQLVLLRVFGAIVLAHLISWMPIIMLILTLAIVDSDSVPLALLSIPFLFFLMHSALLPLIEGSFIPKIRNTFTKVTGIEFCCKLMTKKDGHHDVDQESSPSATRMCCDIYSAAVLPDS